MEHSKFVTVPTLYLKWSCISIVSAALGRKAWIHVQENDVYPNLYVMLAGHSGIRKSTAIKKATKIIKRVKGINLMSNQVTEATLIDQMERASKSTSVMLNNKVYPTGTLYIVAGEASTTLKEIKGNIVVCLTDFYDCGDEGWSQTASWTKETISRGKTQIFNPCVNMLACSNQAFMKEFIAAREIDGGFASRIMFVNCVDNDRDLISEIDLEGKYATKKAECDDMFDNLVEDLELISKMKGKFKKTHGWISEFDKFNKTTEKLKMDNPDSVLNGYYNRRAFHAVRLSQVFSAMDSDEMMVRKEHLLRAIACLEEIEPLMPQVFSYAYSNPNAENIRRIREFIRVKGEVRGQQLTGKFWETIDGEDMKKCLHTLLSMGTIKKVDDTKNPYNPTYIYQESRQVL